MKPHISHVLYIAVYITHGKFHGNVLSRRFEYVRFQGPRREIGSHLENTRQILISNFYHVDLNSSRFKRK